MRSWMSASAMLPLLVLAYGAAPHPVTTASSAQHPAQQQGAGCDGKENGRLIPIRGKASHQRSGHAPERPDEPEQDQQHHEDPRPAAVFGGFCRLDLLRRELVLGEGGGARVHQIPLPIACTTRWRGVRRS